MKSLEQINKSKKITNIFLFVTFIAFAVLQLNDPDGIHWFLIYFVVAGVCLFSNYKIISRKILIAIMVLLLGYAIFHFSLFITYLQTENKEEIFGEMVYDKPYLEGTREFLGLLIAFFGILYQLKKPKS